MRLNNLPIDEDPSRWPRIKKIVHFINSTEKEAIRKGWEKTSLTHGVHLDDSIFEEPDNEVELLLQDRLNELMLEDNSEVVPNLSGVNELDKLPYCQLNPKTTNRQKNKFK